jgi:uncharacterized ion transporter superfamily protein YfcC
MYDAIAHSKAFTAIQEGMTSSAPIIFLILFTGGTIAILEKTGAILV